MGVLKRTMSTALAVMMFFMGFTIAAPKQSIAARSYDREISFLTALGVGGFMPDTAAQMITRGDFAIALAAVLRMDPSETGAQYFDDVGPEHPAYGAISFLVKQEVADGYGDDSFRPEDSITYSEALKLITAALGYNQYASVLAPGEEGYRMAAEDAEVTIQPEDQTQITKGETALLFYKMLHTYYIRMTAGTQQGLNFEKSEELMIKKLYDLEEKTGMVTAVKAGAVYGGGVEQEDGIEIDFQYHQTTMDKVMDYLGVMVDYYVTEDNLVMYMEPVKAAEITEIAYDDLLNATTAREIAAEVGNRRKTYSVDGNAYYVYNGRPLAAPADSDVKPEYGELKLIDNDGNGKIDVVIIWSYQNYVVSTVSATRITLKENRNNLNFLSLDEKGITTNLIYGASYMDIKLLDTNAVISYAESKDGALRTLFVYTGEVDGTLTNYDAGDQIAVIDGQEYEVVPKTDLSPVLGKTTTFFVDKNGKITDYLSFVDARYGLLIKIGYEEAEDAVQFKIMDETGIKKYTSKADKKIKFGVGLEKNGKRTAASDIYSQLADDTGKIEKQLVSFTLTSGGEELATLVVADTTKGDAVPKTDEEEESLRLSYTHNTEKIDSRIYRQVLTIVSDTGKTYLDVHNMLTYVLCISDDEDKCQFMTLDEWMNGVDGINFGSFKAYNRTRLGFYKFLVVEMDMEVESTLGENVQILAVSQVDTALNESDEIELKVSGYTVNTSNSNGVLVSLMKDGEDEMTNSSLDPINTTYGRGSRYPKDTIQWEDIQRGDVILYQTNPMNGNVTAWAMACRAEDLVGDYSNNDFSTARARLIVNGTVSALEEHGIRLRTSELDMADPNYQGIVAWNADDKNEVMLFRGYSDGQYFGGVLRYNSKRNTYEQADWADISVGDRVLTYRGGSWQHERGFYIIIE